MNVCKLIRSICSTHVAQRTNLSTATVTIHKIAYFLHSVGTLHSASPIPFCGHTWRRGFRWSEPPPDQGMWGAGPANDRQCKPNKLQEHGLLGATQSIALHQSGLQLLKVPLQRIDLPQIPLLPLVCLIHRRSPLLRLDLPFV